MSAEPSTQQPILVTFATRGGSTRELAEQIAQVLEQSGLVVDLRAVSAPINVASYSAVVLGSALYFQRLMPEALRFLTDHAALLATRPLVLFSVGAEMRKGTPTAHTAAETWVRRSLAALPQLQPKAIEHFAGAVELRRLSLRWRLLVLISFGERGDWRNIPGVRAWSSAIIPHLLASPVTVMVDEQHQP
jgi:menaquinone-dependent protoporphyrinogen oxidase